MRWTLERWLLIATFICSATAVIFGFGVQWNETTHVKATQNAMAESLRTEYVRADVYASDRRELTNAIDRLTRALEQREIIAIPASPQPHGRQFDR